MPFEMTPLSRACASLHFIVTISLFRKYHNMSNVCPDFSRKMATLLILIQYTNVTDGGTDRQTDKHRMKP